MTQAATHFGKVEYMPNKALQPTPSRFAAGVARSRYRQLFTIRLRSPVRGG